MDECLWIPAPSGVACRECNAKRPTPRRRPCPAAHGYGAIEFDGERWHCLGGCGWTAKGEAPQRHKCPVGTPGWGDKAAAFIKRLGFRQTPDCGCAERQAKLNRAGWKVKRLGSRITAWAKTSIRWTCSRLRLR